MKHGVSLVEAGADILDIGGESSRPGATAVSVEEELARILPIIRGLKSEINLPISVDTVKSEVAHAALSEGAVLVNDISAFADGQMAKTVASHKAACCLSHMRGTPATMQQNPSYGDVVEEVFIELREAVQRAEQGGVDRNSILVDPGIGFGKTIDHNLFLLRRLADFRPLRCTIVVGTSRKAFLGTLTGREEPQQRLSGTLGSIAAVAAAGGADIVRVHDVAQAREALAVADAIRQARKGGECY
jgi:dihydropteroate synthase